MTKKPGNSPARTSREPRRAIGRPLEAPPPVKPVEAAPSPPLPDKRKKIALILREDLRSKLIDGILPFALLLILSLLLGLLVRPFQVFGPPGFLVFALVLSGLSFYSLAQSVNDALQETTRAWYGLVGGIFAWSASDVSILIGMTNLHEVTSFILWIMVALFSITLWRRVLPLGVKFWLQTILLSWAGQIYLSGLTYLIRFVPVVSPLLIITGGVAVAAAMGVTVHLFVATHGRAQRLWDALWLWFLVTTALMVLHVPPG